MLEFAADQPFELAILAHAEPVQRLFAPERSKLLEAAEGASELPRDLRECVSLRMLDAETAARWDELVDPEGLQAPKDIGAFCEMFVEIIFDPYNNGYRGSESSWIDEDGRTFKTDAGDKRYGRKLPNLLPDLRRQDRRIGGPGVEKFAGSRDPATYSPG